MTEREWLIERIRSYAGPGWRYVTDPRYKGEPGVAEHLADHILAGERPGPVVQTLEEHP